MTDDPNEWLDDILLADDPKSRRNWTRRSLSGLSVQECIKAIPTNGQIQLRLPMQEYRFFRDWCAERNITAYSFAKAAFVNALRAHPEYPNERAEAMAK